MKNEDKFYELLDAFLEFQVMINIMNNWVQAETKNRELAYIFEQINAKFEEIDDLIGYNVEPAT